MRLQSLCSVGMILIGTANGSPLPNNSPNPQPVTGIPSIYRNSAIYGRTCDTLELSSNNSATQCADAPAQTSPAPARLLSLRSERNEESEAAKAIDDAFVIGKEPTVGGLMVPKVSQNKQNCEKGNSINCDTDTGPENCPLGYHTGCNVEGLVPAYIESRPVVLHDPQRQDERRPMMMNENYSRSSERRYICWPGDPAQAPRHRRPCPDQPWRSPLHGGTTHREE